MSIETIKLEEFHAPSGRTTPYATFDTNARIYLSSAATKVYSINDEVYNLVKIYYSSDDKIIVLKFIKSDSTEGALSLKSPKQGGAFINAKSFAIHYNMMEGDKLSAQYNGKYLLEKGKHNELGEVFFMNLNEKK